jgi:hypothetical protein
MLQSSVLDIEMGGPQHAVAVSYVANAHDPEVV